MKRIAHTKQHRLKGTGYFIEQATKPQTLGYSLADSPIGLLSWIYEKLIIWTDEYPFTDDEGTTSTDETLGATTDATIVLEWISIYWFSRAGPAASLRIYYELTGGMTHDTDHGTVWSSVPFGASYFPKEIFQLPKSCVTSPNVPHFDQLVSHSCFGSQVDSQHRQSGL